MKSGMEAVWQRLHQGHHRRIMLQTIARVNVHHQQCPSQTDALHYSENTLYHSASAQANGRSAIRWLLTQGLLVNRGSRWKHELAIAWDFVGVLSDWLEEHGKPRLDSKLRSVKPTGRIRHPW
jgi:hypothetical protein